MDRILKYIVIIVITISSVVTIMTATHESILMNVFLIGIGVLSIVTIGVNLRIYHLVGGVSNPD